MATKALKTPFVKSIAKRSYASACPAPKARNASVVSKKISNNIIVSAVDNESPVARVTVAFKAGSRYESACDLGLAHVLRVSAGLTTKNASAFAIIRNLQQMGATLTAAADREHLSYTLEVTQDKLDSAFEFLNATISEQEFRPWELEDNAPRLRYEIASLPTQMRAIDLLHKAAYRRGLGNSLFIAPHRIDKVSSESLQHYACNNLAASRCAFTIVGASLDCASEYAQCLKLGSSSKSTDCPSKYYSGELRKEMGGPLAHVALALEGAAAGTPEALAFAVLGQALGVGPAVVWGEDNSPLGKAGAPEPRAACGFSTSYSDSGLYGIILSCPAENANDVVKALAGALRCGPSQEAIAAAKNRLKIQILGEEDEHTALANSISNQALYTGSAKSPAELACAIDELSPDQIAQVHSKVANGNLSMGAAGNLSCVPYLDEL